jgi:hypothetical protein
MSLHPPGFIEPCLRISSQTAPTDPQWLRSMTTVFASSGRRDGERVRHLNDKRKPDLWRSAM